MSARLCKTSDIEIYRSNTPNDKVDDITNTLRLLQLELPDYEQELSSQNLIPDTFTCFPRMPTEIRQMVWVIALPGRRLINLVPHSHDGGYRQSIRDKRDPKLPITLQVNRESRHVTLKHYRISYQRPRPSTNPLVYNPLERHAGARCMCVDPNVDMFYIDMKECFNSETRVAELYLQDPECFNSIRTLEIRRAYWLDIATDPLEPLALQYLQSGALKYFPGLHALHAVAWSEVMFIKDEDALNWQDMILAAIRMIQMEDHPAAMRSIPKIFFHHCRRRQTCSDEEYMSFAKMVIGPEDQDREGDL